MEVIQSLESELRFLTNDPASLFSQDKMVLEYYWDDLINISCRETRYVEMISIFNLLYFDQIRLHDCQKLIDNMFKHSIYHSSSIQYIDMFDFPSEIDFPIEAFHLSFNCRWRRWTQNIDKDVLWNKDSCAPIVTYFDSVLIPTTFETLEDRVLVGVSVNKKTLEHSKIVTKLDPENLGICFVEDHDLSKFMRYANIFDG